MLNLLLSDKGFQDVRKGKNMVFNYFKILCTLKKIRLMHVIQVNRVVFAKENHPREIAFLLRMHKYGPASTGSLTQPRACGTTFVYAEQGS